VCQQAERRCRTRIIELLREVVRGFRRQHVQLEQFPFPVYGLSLAALREIAAHPAITVNELARLTGPINNGVEKGDIHHIFTTGVGAHRGSGPGAPWRASRNGSGQAPPHVTGGAWPG